MIKFNIYPFYSNGNLITNKSVKFSPKIEAVIKNRVCSPELWL